MINLLAMRSLLNIARVILFILGTIIMGAWFWESYKFLDSLEPNYSPAWSLVAMHMLYKLASGYALYKMMFWVFTAPGLEPSERKTMQFIAGNFATTDDTKLDLDQAAEGTESKSVSSQKTHRE